MFDARLDRASLPTCHKRCGGASPAPGPPAKLARGAPELATSWGSSCRAPASSKPSSRRSPIRCCCCTASHRRWRCGATSRRSSLSGLGQPEHLGVVVGVHSGDTAAQRSRRGLHKARLRQVSAPRKRAARPVLPRYLDDRRHRPCVMGVPPSTTCRCCRSGPGVATSPGSACERAALAHGLHTYSRRAGLRTA